MICQVSKKTRSLHKLCSNIFFGNYFVFVFGMNICAVTCCISYCSALMETRCNQKTISFAS
ncbi:hypothetical protein GBAR_LOCUS29724 [Geodia barretti]|uniref:Uncharacterized protein n=1 Tax=Geodia barretti TaxID=519541 RepID=A0AA35XJU1_GEOBA|nr:hypothetical protein GBAR_LOCUS29724 [Geodia barretti]